MKYELDDDEREILGEFERGELRSIPNLKQEMEAVRLAAKFKAKPMRQYSREIVQEHIGMREGNTIRRIRRAVRQGELEEPFSPNKVNDALGIGYAGTFLPKHRIGNPGGNTELFVQVSHRPALYRLHRR